MTVAQATINPRTPAQETLLKALLSLLPASVVLTDPEDLQPFECDGLSEYRRLPLDVVLPETIEQVQAIVCLCHKLQVPAILVPRCYQQ